MQEEENQPTENLRSTLVLTVSRKWCPGRDLNPHSACAKKDFKSFASCELLAQKLVSY